MWRESPEWKYATQLYYFLKYSSKTIQSDLNEFLIPQNIVKKVQNHLSIIIRKKVVVHQYHNGGHFVFGHFRSLKLILENGIWQFWNLHIKLILYQLYAIWYYKMPEHLWYSENGPGLNPEILSSWYLEVINWWLLILDRKFLKYPFLWKFTRILFCWKSIFNKNG